MVQSNTNKNYHPPRKNVQQSGFQTHQSWTSLQYKVPLCGQNKLPFEKGAFAEWKKLWLDTERMRFLLSDLESFEQHYNILPSSHHVFNMFRMISPRNVKVVIIGDSPYSGKCNITNVSYACGPAFLPHPACVSTPNTLRQIMLELSNDLSTEITQSPYEIILSWIKQGVLLLNSSLTVGVNCPQHLVDHSLLWNEVLVDLVQQVSGTFDPVFLLIGKASWKYESFITSPCIKAWEFTHVSMIMKNRDQIPIAWL